MTNRDLDNAVLELIQKGENSFGVICNKLQIRVDRSLIEKSLARLNKAGKVSYNQTTKNWMVL